MSTVPERALSAAFTQAYYDGFALHGDIDLAPVAFENRLQAVIEKHVGFNPPVPRALLHMRVLHTNDLYLASGCSQPNDRAWRRFIATYAKYITDIARSVTSSHDAGGELASDVLSSLFLHDLSDKSRIASYDGQQSLATWLLAVVSHRAANEARKSGRFEPLDLLIDLKDDGKASKIEADLRASSYRSVINECFKVARDSLSDREKTVLLMRFDEGLRIVEIGRHFKLHPTGITRLLQQTYEKLRRRMISHLANNYRFGPAAIKECLTDIVENPEYSLIALMRDTPESLDKEAVS